MENEEQLHSKASLDVKGKHLLDAFLNERENREETNDSHLHNVIEDVVRDEIGYDTVEISICLDSVEAFEVEKRLSEFQGNRFQGVGDNGIYSADDIFFIMDMPTSNIYFENLKITIFHKTGYILVSGSMQKFLKDSNLHLSQPQDVLLFADKLAKGMGINVNYILNARVKRIDMTVNFQMKHTIQSYLQLLGNIKRLHRQLGYNTSITWSNSMKIRNGTRIFIAYDKIQEMQTNKKTVPREYENKNILRFEERLKDYKEIKRLFHQVISLAELGDDNSFAVLKAELCSTLSKMEIITGNGSTIYEQQTTPSGMKNAFIQESVNYYEKNILSFENALKRNTNLNSRQKSESRRQLKDAISKFDVGTNGDELAVELKEKIVSLLQANKH